MTAAYSSTLMLMRRGWFFDLRVRMVRIRTSLGHSKYHQKLHSKEKPPAASRLESLGATPKGVRGIRCAIGQAFGMLASDKPRSMRWSSCLSELLM
jgi:hypothetical protein